VVDERFERLDNMSIHWDVPIEMDDGAVLRADVFRPAAPGRYPVILTHGPYGKNLSFRQGWPTQFDALVTAWPEVLENTSGRYHVWETVDPEKWVPEGYVCVRVDARGAGQSPGFLDPFSPRETRDYAAAIEWAGEQDWSNGKVGLNGISYYAISQWLVAARQPRHLAAICAWEGAANFYRDQTRHGGILSTFWATLAPRQIWRVQNGLGHNGIISEVTGLPVSGDIELSESELRANRIDFEGEIRRHVLEGDFHRERSVDWSKVEVPFLSAANWAGQGLHGRGNFEAFGQAASSEKFLEAHGYEHWTTFYTDYGRRLQLRFFDHYLKGRDSWGDQPRVLLQVRHPGERFVERAETEWPLAGTEWTPFWLDAAHASLNADAAPPTDAAISYDAPGSDGVTFMAPAADHDIEITGPIAARIWIASTTDDADLFLTLRVFAPDGDEVLFAGSVDPLTPIGQGWLRASQRRTDPDRSLPWRPYHTHDRQEMLVPGEPVALDIEIWPTSIVVPTGYRLALTVAGRDFDHGLPGNPARPEMRGSAIFLHNDPADRPTDRFGGSITVLSGGTHPSCLILPVIPEDRERP
jgi:uncharacterized protein